MDEDAYHARLIGWQTDFGDFSTFFVRRSQMLANSAGYTFSPDLDALENAHKGWAAACGRWQKERVKPETLELSQLKILSLLLHHLVSNDWCPRLFEGGIGADHAKRWANREHLRERLRKCLRAGRGQYLAFQFVIQLMNWFEIHREDRTEPFQFRLTPDLEHDIMVYFAGEKQDELSTFLILKALYARPGESGGN